MTFEGVHTARDGQLARSTLARGAAAGRYVRFHAGVYVESALSGDPATRIAAAVTAFPTATLLGTAALFVGAGWRDAPPDVIELASDALAASTPNVRVYRRRLPSEWRCTVGAVSTVAPAFAVADLAGADEGEAIDRYLREGGRLADVEAAASAMTRWPNSARRRAVIKASRTLPWSGAERLLHRILLDAGIGGWVANLRVVIGGRTYFVDVGFARHRVALEADGFEFHSGRGAFIADRERQNQLVIAGWRVLRFSWEQLQDAAQVAAEVRAAIRESTRRRAA